MTGSLMLSTSPLEKTPSRIRSLLPCSYVAYFENIIHHALLHSHSNDILLIIFGKSGDDGGSFHRWPIDSIIRSCTSFQYEHWLEFPLFYFDVGYFESNIHSDAFFSFQKRTSSSLFGKKWRWGSFGSFPAMTRRWDGIHSCCLG